MNTPNRVVERLRQYAVRFVAANGEETSGTLLASEAAAEIERLEAEVIEAEQWLENYIRMKARAERAEAALRTLAEPKP